jgi:pyridoxal phosphate enzyme (YggS family)
LRSVQEKIAAAATRAGRDAAAVRLVVVTKEVTDDDVAAAIAAGARDLGENRASALRARREHFGASDLHWHMIGTLQRNKARDVVGRAALIHSVDSIRLAEEIAARARGAGRRQDILLQVNASGERTKHGIDPADAGAVLDAIRELHGLRMCGWMTMAPPEDPSAARAAFRRLRGIADAQAGRTGESFELSMGMSGDFEIGVEEGATLVRVGTAVFGARP